MRDDDERPRHHIETAATAAASWRSRFLPTLYDKFFTSNQPFNNFTQNNDQFISLLQTVN
jgi:hypothetical protein